MGTKVLPANLAIFLFFVLFLYYLYNAFNGYIVIPLTFCHPTKHYYISILKELSYRVLAINSKQTRRLFMSIVLYRHIPF